MESVLPSPPCSKLGGEYETEVTLTVGQDALLGYVDDESLQQASRVLLALGKERESIVFE